MKTFLIILIKLYQWLLRPLLGANCRFYPTCSDYALESLQKYGAIKGAWLMLKRLFRCHPWCNGGPDPVP